MASILHCADTRAGTQVMKGVFTCPDDMDPAAQDLLHGLMQKDVSKRIGRLANGADDMRKHEWYSKAGFDWVGCRPTCLPALDGALAGSTLNLTFRAPVHWSWWRSRCCSP